MNWSLLGVLGDEILQGYSIRVGEDMKFQSIYLLFFFVNGAFAERYSVTSGQVTDTVTGLIWQQNVSGGSYTWSATGAAGSAQEYCNQLIIGSQGAGSWRLPTIKELQTLVDDASFDPALDTTAFPGTPIVLYSHCWSSTPLAGNSGNAWRIELNRGNIGYIGIGNTYYVRCVR